MIPLYIWSSCIFLAVLFLVLMDFISGIQYRIREDRGRFFPEKRISFFFFFGDWDSILDVKNRAGFDYTFDYTSAFAIIKKHYNGNHPSLKNKPKYHKIDKNLL